MKLFISYRRSDSSHAAHRLRMCLQIKFGESAVFIDRDIMAGSDWDEKLQAALRECTGVVVLVGHAFLRELRKSSKAPQDQPDVLVREIETALKLNKPIYPVVIGLHDMPEAGKLPESIRGMVRYQATFAPDSVFDAAIEVLMKTMARAHGWTPPASLPEGASPRPAGTGMRSVGVPLLALGAVWLTGRLVAWLADPSGAAPSRPESTLWLGSRYALATALWGLGPYLAVRAVAELRARASLPIYNRHALLSMVNLGIVLLAGGTFLLLSTRPDWALKLLWVFPADPSALHYAAQGLALVAIVFAALLVALVEPSVRRLEGTSRAWGMRALSAGGVVTMLGGLWFAGSLVASTPPVATANTVPMVGYLMLCPALSLLMVVWNYAQSQLDVSSALWEIRTLFVLSIGLYVVCTLAYFAHGPIRLLTGTP